MSCAEDLVEQVEGVGGALVLNGDRIRVRLPEEKAHLIDQLRARRDEVAVVLRRRNEIPSMPQGVRLVRWEPKPAPLMLTPYSVVTDVNRFISMTLSELKAAIAGKRWQSGHWGTRELVDRLEQCGVYVEIQHRNQRSSIR
jgi:hypothetical protein